MARTAPIPNIPAIPGMCPGLCVLAGGAGSGGKGGKGAGSGDGSVGEGGEGGAGDASGDGRTGGCAEGDPVCPITGRMFVQIYDFGFGGPMPLRWERFYNSRTSNRPTQLGFGWTHSFGWRIRIRRRHTEVFDEQNRLQRFDALPERSGPIFNELGWRLRRAAEGIELRVPLEGLTYDFGPLCSDGYHHLVRVRDRHGNATQIERDERGVIVTMTDSAGRPYRVDSDKEGRITRVQVATNPQHNNWMEVVRYDYDDRGDLGCATDAEGFRGRYVYDNHLIIEHQTPIGLSYFYRYDGRDQKAYCVETWGEYPGRVDTALEEPIASAPAGQRDSRRVKGIHYAGLSYSKADRYSEVDNGLGITRYFGDAQGRAVRIIDANGGVTDRSFDPAHGGMTVEVDPEQRARVIDYDAAGDPAGNRQSGGAGNTSFITDEGLHVEHTETGITERRFDERGNLVFVRHADDTVQESAYDERGLLRFHVDPLGVRRTYHHDVMGNCVRVDFSDGPSEHDEYDYLGRRVAHVDTIGRRTEWGWDRRSEIVRKKLPSGAEIHVSRNANRDPVRVVDAGRTTEFEYGGMGWLTQRTDPGGMVTTFRYDVQGNTVAVTNARGQTFRQRFDAMGQKMGADTFEGRRIEVGRDGNGVQTWLDGPDERIVLTHDEHGRLSAMETAEDTLTFDYVAGQLHGIDNGVVKTTFDHDPMGRVIRDQQGSYETAVGWHGGRIAKAASSTGLPLSYRRDLGGELESVSAGSTMVHTDHPQGSDRLSYFDDKLMLRCKYSVAGRLLQRTLTRYDPAVPKELAGTSKDDNVLQWSSYSYNDADQLVGERHSDDRAVEYSLTAAGQIAERRIWKDGRLLDEERIAYDPAGTPMMAGAHYDALMRPNKLHNESFSYDDAGRLVERLTDAGTWRYHWNSLDQLIRVEAPGHVVEMDYDARGRRMRKRVLRQGELTQRTAYVWSNNTISHEVNELDGSTRTYLRKPHSWSYLGHIDVRGSEQTATYYVHDTAGGVDHAVDERGTVVWQADRTVYGHAQPTIETVDVTARFPNQFYDADVGMVYNRHRWYDARLGVYVSPDPWHLAGTLNPRDYVQNPTWQCDPTGLMPHPGVGDGTDSDTHHASPSSPVTAAPATTSDARGRPEGLTGEYLSGPGHWANNTAPHSADAGYAECPETALDRGSGFGSTNNPNSAQSVVDRAGASHGCHSCGSKASGYSNAAHWCCDHQPPRTTYSSSTASRTSDSSSRDASRAASSSGNVRLYPHCRNCASRQGGVMSQMPHADRVSRGLAVLGGF